MAQTVFVTGASRGIGAATARRFAAAGWNVALFYNHNEEKARTLAAQLQQCGCDADCFGADLSDPAAAAAAMQAALARFGRCDALVCNAGMARQELFTDCGPDSWQQMQSTNLGSAYGCIKAVLPHMIARGSGAIVTLFSIWGETGGSCEVSYSASKAAVIGLTKALAKEVGPAGIRVNCVSPGVIDTDMCACFDQETMAGLAEEAPLGRVGQAEDVANAIFFLAGPESAFITGQVLRVNGGMYI